MSESWRLSNATLTIEERKGYLLAHLRGTLATPAEVERGVTLLRDAMTRYSTKRVLVDAQQLELPLPDAACHAAWEFIHAKDYTILACTLPPEPGDLMVTRMNMTGLSSQLPLRAFSSLLDAHRWLDLRPSGIHRRPSMPVPAPDRETAMRLRHDSVSGMGMVASSSSSAQHPAVRDPNTTPKKRPSDPPVR